MSEIFSAHNKAVTLPYADGRISKEGMEIFTSASLVHYFVRPDDYFALNSLELVTADVYLYRLLKTSGYAAVYFVETEGTGCAVYTYDRQSELTFAKNSGGLKQNPDPDNMQSCGRKKTGHFSVDAGAKMKFAETVKNILNDREHKTAVVMPLRMFGIDGYCADAVTELFGSIVKYNETDNMLLLVMTRKSDLKDCFLRKQAQLHDWTGQVLDETGDLSDRERQHMAEDLLIKCGRLVVADQYETDEFANLLFRKIFLKGNRKLAAMETAKVYAAAESLCDYFMNRNTEEIYTTLTKIGGNIIKELNRQLEKENVAQEIVKKASKLRAVKIGYTDKLHPLYIKRVYHHDMDRHKNEYALQDACMRFDQFVGEEMQEVLAQLKEIVRCWAAEKMRIQENKDAGLSAGQMPHLNLMFLGHTGTGKTTLAKLAAGYMKAAGVLPSGRFEYMAAGSLTGTGGQPAAKIRAAARRAAGGVLIIDDFHKFDRAGHDGNTAQEAMAALASVVNEHREDLCIILIGHKDQADKVLSHGAGEGNRFPNRIVFQDYEVDTLFLILEKCLEQSGIKMEEDAKTCVKKVIAHYKQDAKDSFDNAGFIIDKLLPMLNQKRLKREKTDTCIRQDVTDAFPETFRYEET